MRNEIPLARALDQHGDVVGEAVCDTDHQVVTLVETPALWSARRARERFRRIVTAEAMRQRWNEFQLDLGDQRHRIVPLRHASVSQPALARAYQAIWANAEI